MGETAVRGEAFCILENGQPEGCIRTNVYGTYLHGLFDTGELTEKLAAYLADRKGIPYGKAVQDAAAGENAAESKQAYMDREYDRLADAVRHALDMKDVYRICGL